jgi:hypothetical protein
MIIYPIYHYLYMCIFRSRLWVIVLHDLCILVKSKVILYDFYKGIILGSY